MLAGDAGYAALRELPGIGPVLAAVIIAEIGDVTRFRKPGQLCSWAGLTPRHYESDTKVIRGHVSKQGSRMLRWALSEAIQHQPAGPGRGRLKDAIIARRGPEAREHRQDRGRPGAAHPGVLCPARRARPPRHHPGGVTAAGRPGARPRKCVSPATAAAADE